MLFHKRILARLKPMEFIPTSIKIIENAHNPTGTFTKITFNSDCTESKRVPGPREYLPPEYYSTKNIKTADSQDMIFPKMFTDLFQVLFTQKGVNMFQGTNHLQDSGILFLKYIFESMVVPFTKLEKENEQLREELERKTQQYRLELLTTLTLKFALEAKEKKLKKKNQELEQLKEKLDIKYHDYLLEVQEVFEEKYQEIEELKEKLEEKDQDFESMQEELEIKYEDYLQLMQEEIEAKDQELKDAQKEANTQGRLLKTCIEELKTYAEEVEEVEKKNQSLERLNHRLICETSSFVERNSYFSPEM